MGTQIKINSFLYCVGAVAYLLPETDNFIFDFTFVEIYGTAHLYVDGEGTELTTNLVQGDDTGYIHVAPGNTLRLTADSTYRRTNITWGPLIYQGAFFILPNATVEFREVSSSSKRPSHIDIWGQVVGNLAHLMVGFGATLTFKEIAPRSLTFVGITIQKKGRLIFESEYGNTTDRWDINLFADTGPLRRDGKLTVEGGGILETRRLLINAESLDVQYAGLIDLNGQGYIAGNVSRAAIYIFTIIFLQNSYSEVGLHSLRNGNSKDICLLWGVSERKKFCF
jgi:hypothetical protein